MLQAIIAVLTLPPNDKKIHHPSLLVPIADIKVPIDIPHSHASGVSYEAHQTLADVTDLVVVVQKLDMGLDRCLGIFISRVDLDQETAERNERKWAGRANMEASNMAGVKGGKMEGKRG